MTTLHIRSRKRPPSPTQPGNTAPLVGSVHDNLRLHTKYVAPGELKPPQRVLRKHKPRGLKMVEASIREHGFVNPILVSGDGRIVCGHGRWLAATAIGMSLVPVIELGHLTPEQLRIYAIADNRIAEQSEFDLAELKLEFEELEALDLNLNLELTGFETSEIDDLVSGKSVKAEEAGPGDEIPPVEAVAVTRAGDLWQMGNHRLYCGSSLEPESFAILMQGEKAGMIFSDPPYNTSADFIGGNGRFKHKNFAMAAGEMSKPQFTHFLQTSFKRAIENSEDGSIHFQCMDHRHIGEMISAGEQEYTELKNLVVWAKPSAGMGSFYRSQFELIFVWKNGTAPHVNNFGLGETGRHRSNLGTYKGNSGFHRDRQEELAAHPTVKPWILVADAMRDCSKRGSIVLDPFGGSGTLAVAAERTRRKARLIEIDPLYCDVAIRRWEKLTGKEAILAATGQTFAEVASERAPEPDTHVSDPDGDEQDIFGADEGEDA